MGKKAILECMLDDETNQILITTSDEKLLENVCNELCAEILYRLDGDIDEVEEILSAKQMDGE